MIRVLRVLEYEYDSHITYEADRLNWTHRFDVGGGPLDKSDIRKSMTSEVVRVQEIPDE